MQLFIYEHITATLSDDGSSLFVEGRAMRDALEEDARKVCDVISFDPSQGFEECVRRADAVWLVAPEFDGILERLAKQVEAAGKKLIGPTSNAIRLTSDKFAMAEIWQRVGMPTPITWRADSDWRIVMHFPVVLKPIDGAGSTATMRVRDEGELAIALERAAEAGYSPDRLIVQPYHMGQPCSVAFIHGQPLWPMRQFIDAENGFSYSGGATISSREAIDRLSRLAQRAIDCVPGLQGYFGVDLILGDVEANDRVIEINPRLTTSYVGLRQATNENLAERVLFPERFTNPVKWTVDGLKFQSDGRVV